MPKFKIPDARLKESDRKLTEFLTRYEKEIPTRQNDPFFIETIKFLKDIKRDISFSAYMVDNFNRGCYD